jgi:hypothetical protein
VFTIDPPTAKSIPMSQPHNSYELADPKLLQAAQDIYRMYCSINTDVTRRRQPIGVAMNRGTYRGKLIFSSYPILLPEECFIPIQELETELN